MIVGVPRETFPGERRVALVPSVVPTLAKSGLEVVVEAGAGIEAGYPDADYTAKGAKIIAERAEVFLAHDVHAQSGETLGSLVVLAFDLRKPTLILLFASHRVVHPTKHS